MNYEQALAFGEYSGGSTPQYILASKVRELEAEKARLLTMLRLAHEYAMEVGAYRATHGHMNAAFLANGQFSEPTETATPTPDPAKNCDA